MNAWLVLLTISAVWALLTAAWWADRDDRHDLDTLHRHQSHRAGLERCTRHQRGH